MPTQPLTQSVSEMSHSAALKLATTTASDTTASDVVNGQAHVCHHLPSCGTNHDSTRNSSKLANAEVFEQDGPQDDSAVEELVPDERTGHQIEAPACACGVTAAGPASAIKIPAHASNSCDMQAPKPKSASYPTMAMLGNSPPLPLQLSNLLATSPTVATGSLYMPPKTPPPHSVSAPPGSAPSSLFPGFPNALFPTTPESTVRPPRTRSVSGTLKLPGTPGRWNCPPSPSSPLAGPMGQTAYFDEPEISSIDVDMSDSSRIDPFKLNLLPMHTPPPGPGQRRPSTPRTPSLRSDSGSGLGESWESPVLGPHGGSPTVAETGLRLVPCADSPATGQLERKENHNPPAKIIRLDSFGGLGLEPKPSGRS